MFSDTLLKGQKVGELTVRGPEMWLAVDGEVQDGDGGRGLVRAGWKIERRTQRELWLALGTLGQRG